MMTCCSTSCGQMTNHMDRELRHPVHLRGSVSLDDGSSFGVTILDLSHHGCKIETPIAVMPGLRLKIAYVRIGTLDGLVRWYAEGRAGISFVSAPAAKKSETARQAERSALSATVMIRRAGRQSYQARMFDLSQAGCKVEFVERPRAGEQLWVRFEGLDSIEAQVRWVDGFYGGLEFSPHIHSAVYDRLLARLRS